MQILKDIKEVIGLLKDIKNNTAEVSNQNLEIIDKLEIIRVNSWNTSKNTDHRINKYDKTSF